MSDPSAYEQYMLELINAERAKAGAQPLADNGQLNAAAGGHSQWMIDAGVFSHTGANGSSPTDRMTAAGYHFTGAWSDGENIGMVSVGGASGYADELQALNTNLMNSPGHRANILNPSFTELGVGFRVGAYQGQQGAFVTEDFAHAGSQHFLTGVAYHDANHDHFYEPGEGIGGLTVTAVSSTGAKYAAQAYASGGYDLALPTGSYTVTFSGNGIETTTKHVDIGLSNVKVDLVDPAAGGGQAAAAPTTSAAPPTTEPAASTEPAAAASSAPAASSGSLADLLHSLTSGSGHGLSFSNGHFVFV